MTLGCVYTRPLIHISDRENYIHIGVGSDVVCSYSNGHTRASGGGIDDSDDSTLFLCLGASILAT